MAKRDDDDFVKWIKRWTKRCHAADRLLDSAQRLILRLIVLVGTVLLAVESFTPLDLAPDVAEHIADLRTAIVTGASEDQE